MDLKKVKIKKEKDVELMKQKISMLREQLNAAEKILNINEINLTNLKSHEKNIDTKLIKLQNIKKVQQELLQKFLASSSSIAKSTFILENIQNPPTVNATVNQSKTSFVSEANPPAEKLNLLQLKSILTEKINQEKLEFSRSNQNMNTSHEENEETPELSPPPLPTDENPLPPPLPPQTPPPLPPPPPPTPPRQTKSPLAKVPITKKLPSQMTLGGVVAATVTASSSFSSGNNSSLKKLTQKSLPEMTRPNLYTSKQTNKTLEQMALEERTQKDSGLFQNKKSSLEFKINTNENVIINSKVVNINKNSTKLTNQKNKTSTQTASSQNNDLSTKKIVADQDLKNRQRLNDCLDKLLNVNFLHNQCESFDMWSYETLISMNLNSVKQIDLKLKENSVENKDLPMNGFRKKDLNVMLTSANYFETHKIGKL
jgi:hypothetical protein